MLVGTGVRGVSVIIAVGMSDLLGGSLQFLPAPDLFRMLADRRASGTLELRSGKLAATFHFDQGALAGKSVEKAALDALQWEDGTFSFAQTGNPPAGERIEVKQLLADADQRMGEWKRYRAMLPVDSAVLRVVDTPEALEKITLSREQWKLLSRVDGQRSLGQILQAGDDSLMTLRVLSELFANRLIEEVTATPASEKEKATTSPPDAAAADSQPASKASRAPEKTVAAMKLPAGALPGKTATGSVIGCLTLEGPGDATFPLLEHEYSIGRDTHNPIRLEDSSVSSTHARVYRSPEGYVLEDLDSRNGTFVNGERVQSRLLRDNDRVRMGKVQLIYNVAGEKQGISPSTVFQPRPA